MSPMRLAAWGVALLLILLSLSWPMSRSPLPVEDETLFGSASANFRWQTGATPSVLADFPNVTRYDLFYGPASLGVASVWISAQPHAMQWYRSLCLIAAVMICALGGGIVWTCTRRVQWALGTVAIFGISLMIGTRATSGRLDLLTIAAEFAAIYIMFRWEVPGEKINPGVWLAVGACLAFAALSTPRAFPGVAAIIGATLFCLRPFKSALLKLGLAVGVIGLAISAWTFSQGLSPLQWLHWIVSQSWGDKWNSSPVLGGAWIFNIDSYSLGMFFCAALVLMVIALNLQEAMRQWRTAILVIAAGASTFLTLALIGHATAYEVYWMAFPLAAACASFQGVVRGRQKKAAMAALVGVSLFWTGLRVVKDVEIILSWKARDPRPVFDFMAAHVPAGSTVYGPEDYFYYAVEMAGSQYRYTEFNYPPSAPVVKPHSTPQFLIWPDGAQLPRRFKQLSAVAHFKGVPATHPWKFGSVTYPDSTLYECP